MSKTDTANVRLNPPPPQLMRLVNPLVRRVLTTRSLGRRIRRQGLIEFTGRRTGRTLASAGMPARRRRSDARLHRASVAAQLRRRRTRDGHPPGPCPPGPGPATRGHPRRGRRRIPCRARQRGHPVRTGPEGPAGIRADRSRTGNDRPVADPRRLRRL
ncbi:LOW QUALITY PROTEIN: hypothetical protein OPAG_01921, partial [Rhodococcus opacus PD630]